MRVKVGYIFTRQISCDGIGDTFGEVGKIFET